MLLWLGPFDAGALDGAALLEAVSVYTRDLNLETRTATDIRAADARRARGGTGRGGRRGAPGARRAPRVLVRAVVRREDDAAHHRRRRRASRSPRRRRRGARQPGALSRDRAQAARDVGRLDRTRGDGRSGRRCRPGVTDTVARGRVEASAERHGTGGASRLGARRRDRRWRSRIASAPRRDGGRFFGALGYRISTPFGSGSFQQGATAEAGARLGRAGELALGLAVETRATDSAVIGSVSVFDLPIAAEARWVRRGRRLSFGGGGFAAAHLLWSTATSGGVQQTSFDLGAGAGVEALARGPLVGGVAAEARLYAELPIPNTRYLVGGMPVLALGARFGVGLALVFPAL